MCTIPIFILYTIKDKYTVCIIESHGSIIKETFIVGHSKLSIDELVLNYLFFFRKFKLSCNQQTFIICLS